MFCFTEVLNLFTHTVKLCDVILIHHFSGEERREINESDKEEHNNSSEVGEIFFKLHEINFLYE